MPSERDYQELIQTELNRLSAQYPDKDRALAYQLGFLQGFLVKTMVEKPEVGGDFKRQARATSTHQGL